MLYGEVTTGLFLHTTFSADIYILKIILLNFLKIGFYHRAQAGFELSISVTSFGSPGLQVCDTRPALF